MHSDKGVTYLTVSFECWNCQNTAPTHNNGMFQYIAEMPTERFHQICSECLVTLAAEKIKTYVQDEHGMAGKYQFVDSELSSSTKSTKG